jgi:hypothetical protein
MATAISSRAKQEAPVDSFGLVSKWPQGTVAVTEKGGWPYLALMGFNPGWRAQRTRPEGAPPSSANMGSGLMKNTSGIDPIGMPVLQTGLARDADTQG